MEYIKYENRKYVTKDSVASPSYLNLLGSKMLIFPIEDNVVSLYDLSSDIPIQHELV